MDKEVSTLYHRLLDDFCDNCWKWETEEQRKEEFMSLSKTFQEMLTEYKIDITPRLLQKAFIYPKLFLLGKEFFDVFSPDIQRHIKVQVYGDPSYYYQDENKRISISHQEYCWRIKNGLPCEHERGYRLYYRPFDLVDYKCTFAMLQIQAC